MSKDRIKQYQYAYAKGYTAQANCILVDVNLSLGSRVLLMYYISNSDSWKNYTPVMAEQIGVNASTIRKFNKELYEKGYIRRDRQRKENGNLGGWDYEYNPTPIFQNPPWEENNRPPKKRNPNVDERSPKPEKLSPLSVEGLQPSPQKPSMVKLPMEVAPLPMPNIPMPNRPKAMKAMPSSISSSQALEASPSKKPIGKQDPEVRGRRHKRPEAQEETFQWLLGLDLTNEKGVIDDEVLSVLAHKYTRKKLEDTYAHLIHKLEDPKLKIKKSIIAFFRHLLNNEHDCRGTNSDLNAAYARKFSKELGWGTLEIKDKYVIDKNNSAKDISLNMEPSSFRDCIGGLYMSLHGNFGT